MGCIPSLCMPCCLPRSAPRFTIEGVFWARIVKIYDGDTWHGIIRVNGHSSTFVLRLAGLDTPELKGPGVSAKEKEAAAVVRNYCQTNWLHKTVRMVSQGMDKYGRLLVTVYPLTFYCFACRTSVNQDLLKKGYAMPYDGGTKSKWVEHELDAILGDKAFLPYD